MIPSTTRFRSDVWIPIHPKTLKIFWDKASTTSQHVSRNTPSDVRKKPRHQCTEKISPAKPGLRLLHISHRETGETEIHTLDLWKFIPWIWRAYFSNGLVQPPTRSPSIKPPIWGLTFFLGSPWLQESLSSKTLDTPRVGGSLNTRCDIARTPSETHTLKGNHFFLDDSNLRHTKNKWEVFFSWWIFVFCFP